jgi:hypothetical protein
MVGLAIESISILCVVCVDFDWNLVNIIIKPLDSEEENTRETHNTQPICQNDLKIILWAPPSQQQWDFISLHCCCCWYLQSHSLELNFFMNHCLSSWWWLKVVSTHHKAIDLHRNNFYMVWQLTVFFLLNKFDFGA